MKTGIVILAAGESARMGVPKQLLEYDGATLLQHVVATALAVRGARVAVVLGAHAAQVRTSLDEHRVMVVENTDWANGMGSSLRAGLSALLAEEPGLTAAIFLTCDQPFLTTKVLDEIIATHRRSECLIVAAEYDGTLGVPALFARPLFGALLALSGESGARWIIQQYREQAIGVPFPEGAIDIDTPSDYEHMLEHPTLTHV